MLTDKHRRAHERSVFRFFLTCYRLKIDGRTIQYAILNPYSVTYIRDYVTRVSIKMGRLR